MDNIILSFDKYFKKYNLGRIYQYETKGNVHIDDIIGSCSKKYIGKTFSECLKDTLKIELNNELLEKTSGYYFNKDLSKDISFFVFDFGKKKEIFVRKGEQHVFLFKMLKDINKNLKGFKDVNLTIIKIDRTVLENNKKNLLKFDTPTMKLLIKVIKKEDNLPGTYKIYYKYLLNKFKDMKNIYINTFSPEDIINKKASIQTAKKVGIVYFFKEKIRNINEKLLFHL